MQVKALRQGLRRLKNDWEEVQRLHFPQRTVDQMKKALNAFRKQKYDSLFLKLGHFDIKESITIYA